MDSSSLQRKQQRMARGHVAHLASQLVVFDFKNLDRRRKLVMNALKHIYWAVRYGKWHLGWGQWEDKPQWGFYHNWFDGNHAVVHIYKLWIGVEY